MTEIRFLIGVDGGGTNCRAALATRQGRIIGRGEAGSSNIATDLDAARVNIAGAIAEAFRNAGVDLVEQTATAAWLGLAGATVGPFAANLRAGLNFALVHVGGDAPIALQGALQEGDGAIAILGTGSAFLLRRNDECKLVGGWGFNLSDHGGGARLGHAALQLTLLAHDKMRPHGALTREILHQFDGDPDKFVLFAKQAKPADYGRFAPVVVHHAAAGDSGARGLMQEQASYVDAAFDALNDEPLEQIALLGGLAEPMSIYLAERHRNRLIKPRTDALTGAVELAGKLARGAFDGMAGR